MRSVRLRALVAALGLPLGLVSATPHTFESASTRTPLCAALRISVGSTSLTARHVHAYLLFTNQSSSTSRVVGYPTVRFVTAKGLVIGNPAQHAGRGGGAVTLAAGQVSNSSLSESLTSMFSPSACDAKHATGIQVTPPGTRHRTVLRFPGPVCSGRAIHESKTASMTLGPGPTPRTCATAQLTVSIGASKSATGTRFVALVFTNPIIFTCTVEGYPRVRSVNGHGGASVGPPASPRAGTAPDVWIEPFGGTASAALGIDGVASFSHSSCRARSAVGLEVSAPHSSHTRYLAYPHVVCTRRSSTHVAPIVEGS